jgi:hypothetical protein
MTTLRAQVALPNSGGIPSDTATNTWHFLQTGGSPETAADDALTMLDAFYQDIQGIFSSIVNSPLDVTIYDLEDAVPRIPIHTGVIAITPGSGGNLPNEVAICLSFQGTQVSGNPPARRRGRIFLGPLDAGTVDTGGSDVPVSDATCGLIRDSADTLRLAGGSLDCSWATFSPTTAGAPPWSVGEIAASTLTVVGGWCDNAFDTIRSRGSVASERFLFPT